MSVVALKEFWQYPPITAFPASMSSFTIDALNELSFCVFDAPVTGDITDVVWKTGATLTASGANPDFSITVGIQTVDATTGYPTGTYLGSGNAKKAIAETSLATNTTYTTTLDAAAAVTQGIQYALTVTMTTWDTAGALTINHATPAVVRPRLLARPYSGSYLSATWAKTNSETPMMGVKIGSAFYACNAVVPSLISLTSYRSNTTPDELGNVIVAPFTMSVSGFWVWFQMLNSNVDVTLYNSATGVIETVTIDKDIVGAASGGLFRFTSSHTLTSGELYRIAITSTDAVNYWQFNKYTFANADIVSMETGANNVYGTQRTDAGSWTDLNSAGNTYSRFPIGLILDGIDIPAATGVIVIDD